MAEALSAVVSMASMLKEISKTFSSLGSTDSALEAQLQRFSTEKAIFDRWMTNCSVSNASARSKQSIPRLVQNFREDKVEIDKQLAQHASRATAPKASARRHRQAPPKYEAISPQNISQMTSVLKDLNGTLQAIRPPVPPRYDESAMPDPALLDVGGENAPPLPPRRPPGLFDELLFDEHPSGRAPPAGQSPEERVHRPRIPTPMRSPRHDICRLWKASSRAFATMSLFAPVDPLVFHECHQRLNIWGAGLFNIENLHLDAMVDASTPYRSHLSEPIASHFIDMAFDQVRIINTWLTGSTKRGFDELEEAAMGLKVLLITAEMTQPLMQDVVHRSLGDLSPEEVDQRPDEPKVDSGYFREMVEILFQYLPAINHVWRMQLMETERLSKLPKETSIPDEVGDEVPSRADELIDNNLLLVKQLESKLKADTNMKAYHALCSKERQRLEEWKFDSLAKRRRFGGADVEVEVEKMQLQALQTLEDVVAKKGLSGPSRPSEKAGKDVKEKMQEPWVEEQVRSAIESFSKSVAHLYRVAP